MIVAHGSNREIGKDNKLLWHIPEDMKKFIKFTKGKSIIVGRKTFESFGKPLPNRDHLVLTTNRNYSYEHPKVKIFYSVEDILKYLETQQKGEVVVCGGAKIYDLFFEKCQRLYISEVHWSGQADTYLSQYDLSDFKCIEHEAFDETDKTPSWTFKIYEKAN